MLYEAFNLTTGFHHLSNFVTSHAAMDIMYSYT